MNKPTSMSLSVALALVLMMVTGSAAAAGPYGYLSATDGVAKNSAGECWRGAFWDKSNAIAECDPDLVPRAVETAAMEVPAAVIMKKAISVQADTQFGFDSATLTDEGRRTLDELAAMLRNRESKVMITGYTDRIGPLDHNMGLSARRAEAVRDYLTNLGVGAAEMETDGKGPSNPLVACEGKRGRRGPKRP